MILITNLIIYANQDKYLVVLGSLIGIVIHFILQMTIKEYDSVWVKAIVSLFCTKIGFDMIKGNHDMISRFILVLLPIFFMSYYQFDSFTTLVSILSCVIYYATVTYFLEPVRKCCYSFIVYFFAAISIAQVFGTIERIVTKSMSNQHPILEQMMNSRWISTSYIIYWMIISICLVYETKK